ncbi:MAG TPA: hypothetical protein DIC22_13090 [Chitinophagaceae bacterium]|nr:hypothetical protein [Chitinophagaceae bacterium]
MKKLLSGILIIISGIVFLSQRNKPVITDFSPIFQAAIDSCIRNNIPEYDLPAGYFPCKEPLILSNWGKAYYRPFSLILKGYSTFAGADGSGTILDFSSMKNGFGIGIQGGKGVEIIGLKLIGGWNYKFPGAYRFYNTPLSSFTDSICRDTRYSPYFAIVIDPFGPSVPSDGGYPGLSAYYRGSNNGSTGTYIADCYMRNWVGGIITSPNGHTANADLTIIDRIQLGNMKIGIAGCQDQEKMNHVSNVMAWGVIHTIFATNIYGAGSVGNWDLDHFNIAGYTNEIIYNNQGGYFPTYLSYFYAESIARFGTMYSTNGSTVTNSTLNFAGYREAGTYTDDMINGYGVTFVGDQLRIYGQFTPVTINTGPGANNMHFRDCSFDVIPIYPQTYPYGFTDFQNCTISESFNILNPIGPQSIRPGSMPLLSYGRGSNVAARNVLLDGNPHKITRTGPNFSTVIKSDSSVKLNDVILATYDRVIYRAAGIVTRISPGQFTLSYTSPDIDSTKNYFIYLWKPVLNTR